MDDQGRDHFPVQEWKDGQCDQGSFLFYRGSGGNIQVIFLWQSLLYCGKISLMFFVVVRLFENGPEYNYFKEDGDI